MRALFLLLVAANLGFFAWVNYFALPDAASDPRPLTQQIAPEKLKILSPEELAASLPAKPGSAACIEWGSFTLAAAPRAEQALEPLALGARLSSRRAEETARWWVFIPPPAGGRAAAQKTVSELKSLGVDEYFVMQEEGRMRWAISLGVFGSEAAANGRLEALRAKGVRIAQVGARDTQVTKVSYRVQNPDPATQARISELAQGFPGSELRGCPSGN